MRTKIGMGRTNIVVKFGPSGQIFDTGDRNLTRQGTCCVQLVLYMYNVHACACPSVLA